MSEGPARGVRAGGDCGLSRLWRLRGRCNMLQLMLVLRSSRHAIQLVFHSPTQSCAPFGPCPNQSHVPPTTLDSGWGRTCGGLGSEPLLGLLAACLRLYTLCAPNVLSENQCRWDEGITLTPRAHTLALRNPFQRSSARLPRQRRGHTWAAGRTRAPLASSRGRPPPLARRALTAFSPTAFGGRGAASANPAREGVLGDEIRGPYAAPRGENAPQGTPNPSRPRGCIGARFLPLPEDASRTALGAYAPAKHCDSATAPMELRVALVHYAHNVPRHAIPVVGVCSTRR